jgi:hypothetical protein
MSSVIETPFSLAFLGVVVWCVWAIVRLRRRITDLERVVAYLKGATDAKRPVRTPESSLERVYELGDGSGQPRLRGPSRRV